jgi:hypothetical protein
LEQRELPALVLIKFDDESIESRFKDINAYNPIPPAIVTFQAMRGIEDIERRMLLLILRWAVTIHKLQGATLNGAVIDFDKENFPDD